MQRTELTSTSGLHQGIVPPAGTVTCGRCAALRGLTVGPWLVALLVGISSCRHGTEVLQVAADADTPTGKAAPQDSSTASVKAASPDTPTLLPPPPSSAGTCPSSDSSAVALLIAPEHPYVGGTLKIVAAELGDEPLAVRVEETSPKPADSSERDVEVAAELRAGLPTATIIRWVPQHSGTYRAIVGRQGAGLRCVSFTISARRPVSPGTPRAIGHTGLWPTRRSWSSGEEALYGAWIREMFRAPIGQELAFGKLDEVTSNPERNLLHGYLGWDEDSTKPVGLRLKPDCADTPYFFRAYYAWKRGLPFGFRSCDGGKPGVAPSCGALTAVAPRPDPDRLEAARQAIASPASAASNPNGLAASRPNGSAASRATGAAPSSSNGAGTSMSPAAGRPDVTRWLDSPRSPTTTKDGKRGELAAVQEFFTRTLAWGVHTGNARTAYGDDATDFYPVSLTAHGLRPGSIYADPYGHVLMVVELIPPAGGRPGVLYAADGQPDGSFTRKRFWEGNFLFNPDPALGGSGFKAFRPLLVRERAGEQHLVSLKDSEIAKEPGYGDISREQASLTADAFYDRMERLITPGTRDAMVAQEELVRALAEAARVRVTSVDNGQKYFAEHPNAIIEMPKGEAIFEASGPWEDFSTPARDLRLLIAIDVVTHFDKKVARNAESYGVNDKAALEALRNQLTTERERLVQSGELAFSYTRSDGSKWPISLSELIARAAQFEIGYNPNDCPELRWGAPADSQERSTCKRRAPEEQTRKLEAYRVWFHERRRPPRGDPGAPVQ